MTASGAGREQRCPFGRCCGNPYCPEHLCPGHGQAEQGREQDDPLHALVESGLTYAEAEAAYDLAGQSPDYRTVLREMALRGDMRLTANQRRHLSGREQTNNEGDDVSSSGLDPEGVRRAREANARMERGEFDDEALAASVRSEGREQSMRETARTVEWDDLTPEQQAEVERKRAGREHDYDPLPGTTKGVCARCGFGPHPGRQARSPMSDDGKWWVGDGPDPLPVPRGDPDCQCATAREHPSARDNHEAPADAGHRSADGPPDSPRSTTRP